VLQPEHEIHSLCHSLCNKVIVKAGGVAEFL
jgi:hypothetical protein